MVLTVSTICQRKCIVHVAVVKSTKIAVVRTLEINTFKKYAIIYLNNLILNINGVIKK